MQKILGMTFKINLPIMPLCKKLVVIFKLCSLPSYKNKPILTDGYPIFKADV